MNKTELIDALAEHLGDKKIAAAAVAGLVDVVVRAVNGGDKVTITGFGVFERRARAARMARNPRTGESVRVKKTTVPTFRPGTLFREVVSGVRTMPSRTPTDSLITKAAASGSAASQSAAEHPREINTAKAARKAAKAAAKAARKRKESKATTKAPMGATANAPTKTTAKKAVKKSATKK